MFGAGSLGRAALEAEDLPAAVGKPLARATSADASLFGACSWMTAWPFARTALAACATNWRASHAMGLREKAAIVRLPVEVVLAVTGNGRHPWASGVIRTVS